MSEAKKRSPTEVWKILPTKHKIISVVMTIVAVSASASTIYYAATGSFPSIVPLLTPARDLTGTWRNPLPGQGFIVSSKGLVQYHDVEWKLKQSGNTIAGPMTITYVKGDLPINTHWIVASPNMKKIAPDMQASVILYVTGTVEGSKITINLHDLTGAFLTDLMTLTAYQPDKIEPGLPGGDIPSVPYMTTESHFKLSLSRVR